MDSKFFKDAAGFVLACLIGAGLAQYHQQTHFDPHVAWDGFTLPGFDAHVYVAMAEEPRFFTVGPWGYRLLLPGLVGALLPPRLIVPGFLWAAQASLIAASGLLFIYLKIRGATSRASILASLAMMATPSVSAVFANPFLVEPLGLALLLLALIAIEGGAGLIAIALALALLSLVKEVWLLLLPVLFVRELGSGAWSAALKTLRAASVALWVRLLMGWMWSPQSGAGGEGPDTLAILGTIAASLPVFAPQFLLGGLAVPAMLALSHAAARDYLKRHALTVLALLALPIGAAVYTGAGAATAFFSDDVRRLLIYVLPFAAALAVHLDPAHSAPRRLPPMPGLATPALFLIAALAIAPLALDRYSRMDLSTSRDGPYVLGTVRESLRTARRLDRGDTVVFDPESRKFAWGVSPPSELGGLRFFLRGGFGPLAHYGIHDIRMRETEATLVLPVLEPRRLLATLTMDARESAWVTFLVGGRKVGEALVGPQAVAVSLDITPEKLFRGDNPMMLQCENAAVALPRLLRLELTQPTIAR